MLTKIYDLAYEVDGDDVNLEQDMGCGDVHRITLHRIHLQMLAEQAGLCRSSNVEDARIIARLGRQLQILRDRIDELDDRLNQAAQRGHEDLSVEIAFGFATWELANEFCADLPAVAGAAAPAPPQPALKDATP